MPKRKPPHPKYPLTRATAAKLAGTTYGNILAGERRGELHPLVDANGAHWHNKAEVERMGTRIHEKATRRLEGVSMASLTSEQAALVVEKLEAGMRPGEIAVLLRLHIGAIKRIWLEWAETDPEAMREVAAVEAIKLQIERARARARSDNYAEFRDFRIKDKELSAQIARDYRRAEEIRASRGDGEKANGKSPIPSLPELLAPARPTRDPS